MEPSSPTLENLLDIASLPQEEHLLQALKAISVSGTQLNGLPTLSLQEAAKAFGIPQTTLTNRFHGVPTRKVAHAHQQNLAPVQEEILVEWIKVMGQQGVPVMPGILCDYTLDICGKEVSASWGKHFMARHPELKVKWTTLLEQCRARSLNPTVVKEYFDLLKQLIDEYNITLENIYNMDEKGIQLGIGACIAALVDRDQKTIYQVEDGNRELITVIECISADGMSIQPSVIFQGARQNLEWG